MRKRIEIATTEERYAEEQRQQQQPNGQEAKRQELIPLPTGLSIIMYYYSTQK